MANEQGPRWQFDSTGDCRGLARDNVVVVGRTVSGGLLWPSIDLQREILTALNNRERLFDEESARKIAAKSWKLCVRRCNSCSFCWAVRCMKEYHEAITAAEEKA